MTPPPATLTREDSARNRAAARAAGQATFTGTRCRAARHDGTRYTSTGACVACLADKYRAARRRRPVTIGPAAAAAII